MGLLSDLFGSGKQNPLELLSHFSGMELREFVIADDLSDRLCHYFRFKDREGKDEEFIVVYRRTSDDTLRYARTHWRQTTREEIFRTLNERSPWSSDISRLIDIGQDLSSKTRPIESHFSLQVAEHDSIKPTGSSPTSGPHFSAELNSPGTAANAAIIQKLAAAPSRWQVQRGETDIHGQRPKDEFSRTYEFSNLPPPDSTASLRIECTIQSDGIVHEPNGQSGLRLSRSIRFYLKPFRLPHEANFVLRISNLDGSEGGEFDVIATPIDADTTVFGKFGGRNDTATLLRAIMAGADLTFEVLQDGDSLVKLPIHDNDDSFKRMWDESANRFVELETVYDLVRSQAEQRVRPEQSDLLTQARQNPRAYAVWMVELEPGQYGVLLVRLDGTGGMQDAWQIGDFFTNRTDQGSFALQMARDLGISLSDVVKSSE